MYQHDIEFHLEPIMWSGAIQLWMRQRLPNGFAIATKIEMSKMSSEEPQEIHNPLMTFDTAAAQQLMDELWKCGLRPSEGTGSAGQLASVQYHLEDMRRLVFEER